MAADKRLLYHLAPTQTPSPQFRKQLAQGRLDTSQHGASYYLERDSVAKGYSPAEHKPNPVTPTKSKEPRHPYSPTRTTTEHENPRLRPPSQYTEPGQVKPLLSPQTIEPSSSLSLSENDDCTNSTRDTKDKQRHHESTNQMRRNDNPLSPNRSEVPVVTSIATSPVKVVCHSPRRSMNRDDEGHGSEVVRGYVDKASRVEVPGVTKVAIKHSEEQKKPFGGHDESLSEDSLDNSKVQTIAGSPVDPNSSAVRVALDDNGKENAALLHPYDPDQYKSFIGDEHGHHGGPLSAALNQSNIRQQLFDFSVASVDCSVSVEPSAAGDISVADDKKRKKKRAGRIIPSRYMESKKAPQVKKSASFQAKKKVSFNSTSREHSSQQDFTLLSTTAPYHHNTSLKGSKIVTSTPAVGSIGMIPGHSGGDMVAPTPILPQTSKLDTGERGVSPQIKGTSSKMASKTSGKHGEKTKKAVKMKAPLLLSLLPQKHVDNINKLKGPEIGELSQRQLELEYARLLQWIFLESKLKSTFHQQEKDAQAQLYSMWQENEKLRRELTELQLDLDKKNKITELDEQLNLQLSGLKPIGGNLAKQILHYDQLSSALNTTCQYMPVSGVKIDNREELLVALSESERLLGEIDGLTRHRTHKICNFSKELGVLSKVSESEVQEQGRCQELLAAASTLGTQELSLQAHVIQQSIPSYTSSDDRSL